MSRVSVGQARRFLQVALGLVWLLDAALQFQPFMFGRGFALEILRPTAAGNPQVIARPVVWSAQLVLAHPQFWNTVFASTQLLIGLAFFWRRSVKLALVGTVGWSLIVWWLGEGLGGVLAGSAAPLMGSPGAVVLYALLALLLWPAGDGEGGRSLAEMSILRSVAAFLWLLLWAGEAYFALLPANDSPAVLHGMLAGMAEGEPHALAVVDRMLASLAAHQPIVGPGFGALLAVSALAPFLPARFAKPALLLAMSLAAVIWVGQDFGGILTGQGTDPNSGLLLFLLALAYWPIKPDPVPAAAVDSRPRRRTLTRSGIAVAVAVVVGASSLASATGLTVATAATSPTQTRLTIASSRMLGPGPTLGRYKLAGYKLVFRDSSNRATRPGIVSLNLHRNNQPLNNATVTLTYHSIDMHMPSHTLHLLPSRHGRYSQIAPRLPMGGRWRLAISIVPQHGQPLLLTLTDLISL